MMLLFLILGLFLLTFCSTVKIAFELNFGISIYTNTIEALHVICIHFSTISYVAGFLIKHKLTPPFFDSEQYFSIATVAQLDGYARMILSLCLVFYPFRLFLFLARFKFATPIKAHLNVMFRTIPGMSTFMMIFFVIYISISFVVYYLLKPHLLMI
jgi:hypothetical protein